MPTNSEANDINTVIEYLINYTRLGAVPDDDRALDAAKRLADRAYNKLYAGLTADEVAQAWPRRRGADSTP